jgi:dihydropteroate synthase
MRGIYYRPIAQSDRCRPLGALKLAGGAMWFTHVERLQRGADPCVIPAMDVPAEIRMRLSANRADICGLSMDTPRIMGILNATPDSFSDGGRFDSFETARKRAKAMAQEGADILDIGGESTRPGADFVQAETEQARTEPLIRAITKQGNLPPVSIDTRKAEVARAAIGAGAGMFNDVSALGYDAGSASVAAKSGVAVCLMHASGDPKTMQDNPAYGDVLLDVYDYLQARIDFAMAQGIARERIVVDPGIGFGKTQDHNLALLRGLSLFHGLGCPVLLGVSRKGFIGVIGNAQEAAERAPGSIAVGLEGLRQGVQILRVHDIVETKQAISLWRAML